MMSPMQIVQQIMARNPAMNNPMIKNAMQMAQNGDFKGVEEMARNLCQEKNIDVDKALTQIKGQFGLR